MVLLSIVASAILGLSIAGESRGQTVPAPPTLSVPAKAMDALVVRFEHEMIKAAMSMPAEKYSFTPASLNIVGAKFVKVRTFADEVKHVAQANYAISGNIEGMDLTLKMNAIDALKDKNEILAALEASFAEVHKAIALITVANENDSIDDVGVAPNQTKESEAAWVAVHGYDHYGQMVEYLRLSGIVPGT